MSEIGYAMAIPYWTSRFVSCVGRFGLYPLSLMSRTMTRDAASTASGRYLFMNAIRSDRLGYSLLNSTTRSRPSQIKYSRTRRKSTAGTTARCNRQVRGSTELPEVLQTLSSPAQLLPHPRACTRAAPQGAHTRPCAQFSHSSLFIQ